MTSAGAGRSGGVPVRRSSSVAELVERAQAGRAARGGPADLAGRGRLAAAARGGRAAGPAHRARADHRHHRLARGSASRPSTSACRHGAARSAGKRVGVLAVDPSSPFSGRRAARRPGPDAGPRDRPRRLHPLDGQPRAPRRAGVGDAAGAARARRRRLRRGPGRDRRGRASPRSRWPGSPTRTLVLLAPGMGDGIQAAKAGILEIGDVFVVNKADRDGADQVVRDLRSVLNLGAGRRRVAAADREDGRADRARASTTCSTRSTSTARTWTRRASATGAASAGPATRSRRSR